MSSFIRLVCHTSELQSYTTRRLFNALKADVSQESMTLVAVWILGEFGDTVMGAPLSIGDDDMHEVSISLALTLLVCVTEPVTLSRSMLPKYWSFSSWS
jgi:AP-1 complex subunit gamma-1